MTTEGHIDVSLYNVNAVNAMLPSEDRFNSPDIGAMPIEKSQIKFIEETSTSELRYNTDQVLDRLMDRLASAFGLWRKK